MSDGMVNSTSGDWYKASSHIHCSRCGEKVVESHRWIDRYDEITGEPIMRYRISCPNRSVFSLGHFSEQFEGEDMIINYDY